MTLTPDQHAARLNISTATITTVLLKNGIRNSWMRGPMAMRAARYTVVGEAFTMRFVPMREDLATAESWSSPHSTRVAIEEMPAGCIAFIGVLGISDAGVFGDLLTARLAHRRVTALVTDGTMRDSQGILGTGLPVWCAGTAAPPSIAALTLLSGCDSEKLPKLHAQGNHTVHICLQRNELLSTLITVLMAT